MRIWFDLSNSPHVVFFAGLIRELRTDHEIVISCRDLANTIDLLDLEGFPYHRVGKHYGARTAAKIYGFGARVLELARFVRREKPDVAVSHSSYYSPVVARLLGIPSLYLNDNEHAEGNRFAFITADRVMMPEFVPLEPLRRQWVREARLRRYPGVKEGVYLWQHAPSIAQRATQIARRPLVVVRPEPWAAHYYTGRVNFIDRVLLELQGECRVLVVPRGEIQATHYRSPEFAGIEVALKAIRLDELMSDCALFIGAGGTMTREAAVLGIPTISIYQDDLLEVDRYLIGAGCLIHRPDLTAAEALAFLETRQHMGPRVELLEKGRQAYDMIKSTLLSLPSRARA